MTYNEVMGNINKLNVKIERKDFDGGFFVLILRNDDNIINYSFTIRTKDKTLIVMSFSYDIINGKCVKREDFVGMFCKKYNVPKMEYKYDGEWIYQYDNITEGYNIIMYDKAVKISIIDKK